MKLSTLLRRVAAELREAAADGSPGARRELAAEADARAAVIERVAAEVKFNRFADSPTPTARQALIEIGEQT